LVRCSASPDIADGDLTMRGINENTYCAEQDTGLEEMSDSFEEENDRECEVEYQNIGELKRGKMSPSRAPGTCISNTELACQYDRLQSKEFIEDNYALPERKLSLKEIDATLTPYYDSINNEKSSSKEAVMSINKTKHTSQYNKQLMKECMEDTYDIPEHNKTWKNGTLAPYYDKITSENSKLIGNAHRCSEVPNVEKSVLVNAAKSSIFYPTYNEFEDVSKPMEMPQQMEMPQPIFTGNTHEYAEIPTVGKSTAEKCLAEKDDGPTYYELDDMSESLRLSCANTTTEEYSKLMVEKHEANTQVKIVKSKGSESESVKSTNHPKVEWNSISLDPTALQKGILSSSPGFYQPKQTTN